MSKLHQQWYWKVMKNGKCKDNEDTNSNIKLWYEKELLNLRLIFP